MKASGALKLLWSNSSSKSSATFKDFREEGIDEATFATALLNEPLLQEVLECT